MTRAHRQLTEPSQRRTKPKLTCSFPSLRLIFIVAATLVLPRLASAQTIITAYAVPTDSTANQFIPNPLGLDFDVNTTISVLALGVFDSGQDGLAFSHVLRIYDRTTELSVATVTVPAGTTATLAGGSRFVDLAVPLVLNAGFQGTIVAEINSTDGNGNTHGGPAISTLNTGGGALTFVGGGRVSDNGPGTYPARLDGGPVNRYLAGTFTFVTGVAAVPEPATNVLLALGVGVLLLWRGRKFPC